MTIHLEAPLSTREECYYRASIKGVISVPDDVPNPAWDAFTAPSWPNVDSETTAAEPKSEPDLSIEDTQSIRPVAPKPPDVDQILRGEYTGWVPIIKAGESLEQAEQRNKQARDARSQESPAEPTSVTTDSIWLSLVDDPETAPSPAQALEEARARIAQMRENLIASLSRVSSVDIERDFAMLNSADQDQEPDMHSEQAASESQESVYVASEQQPTVEPVTQPATDLRYEDLFEALTDAGIDDDETAQPESETVPVDVLPVPQDGDLADTVEIDDSDLLQSDEAAETEESDSAMSGNTYLGPNSNASHETISEPTINDERVSVHDYFDTDRVVIDTSNAIAAPFVLSPSPQQDNALELVIMRDEIKDLRERLDHSQKMIEDLMHRIANLAEIALTQRKD